MKCNLDFLTQTPSDPKRDKIRKAVRFLDRWVDRGLILIFLALFLLGGYALYDSYRVYMDAADPAVAKFKPGTETWLVDPLASYELSVSKYVEGNMGDRTRQFNFRLTLTKSDLAEIPASLEYIKEVWVRGEQEGEEAERGTLTLTDGACEFTLADYESIRFTLPNGILYTVEELDGEDLGYEVTSIDASGQINFQDVVCDFFNSKESTVPTGFSAMTGAAAMLPVVSGIGIVLLIKKKRPKKEKK